MNLSHTSGYKSALVIEGGAMRSVFSAGLLDGFLENNFNPFDFYMGVSAGAYNLASYLSGQYGLSMRVYCEVANNKQFINYARFMRGGHLLDLDWLANKLTTESRLDPAMEYVCATVVTTGQAVYINIRPEIFKQAILATTALPLIYRDFPRINGIPMTDGGVADGLPVAEAIRKGAGRIMVVRSRPKSYLKKDTLWHKYIRWKLKRYPALVHTMQERVKRFDDSIRLIQHPPDDVKIIEICPPEQFTLGRFSCNLKKLQFGYKAGLGLSERAIEDWHALDGRNT
jgi:predicted patatin/cPLA2 family phospholipase